MKIKHRHIILLVLLISILTACNTTKLIPEGKHLLVKNKIISNEPDFNTDPIKSYIKQKENTKTALLFNFHLWVYNLAHDKSGKKRKIKKWLGIYKLGDIIGEAPVILSNDLTLVSTKQIEKYMRNKGYYQAHVTDSVYYYVKNKKKADVYYRIKAGTPIIIDSVYYTIKNDSIAKFVSNETKKCLIKKGDKIDVDIFQKERKRISSLLKDKGYFSFNKEYIYYEVDTLNTKPYKANIEIKILDPESGAHKQYTIKNIYFFNNFEPEMYLRHKEAYYQEFDTSIVKEKYFLNRHRKPHVHPKFLAKNTYLEKGQIYSSSDINNTYRKLSSLNEYKLINIQYNKYKKEPKLDVLIQLTPFKKHNYIVEIKGTNSSGNFGIGGQLNYQHKSLFGRAEIFDISVYSNLETRNNNKSTEENFRFNSQEIGASASIKFPKFLLPFRSEAFIKRNNPKTVISANINYKTRPEYTRNVYGASFGYNWVSKKVFRHQLNALDISAVKVYDINDEYRASIKNTHLEHSFDDYLIVGINYRLYFTSKKENSKKSYFKTIFKGETAGNLLDAYSQLAKLKKEDGNYKLFENTFAQYWKTELDVSFNQRVGRNRLVYRIYSGLAQPYGNISVMPYVKQFYSGGANSIRAWGARSLGPGGYYNSDTRFYNEVGDLKLEGNLEYRFKLFWIIEGAWFLDVGNIWSINQKDKRSKAQFDYKTFLDEIAIGTGLGFRFDFSYLIFRIDYGLKVKDPKEDLSRRWVWNHKSFSPFNKKYFAINFGIGYPF